MAYLINSKKKVFSLQETALHEIAKLLWGDHVLVWVPDRKYRDHFDFFSCEEYSKLKNHGRSVLKRVSEIVSDILPKALVGMLEDAVFRLGRGYSDALSFTRRHKDLNKLVTPCPLTTGPYSAKNFIDPSGRFDEGAWARRLVADESRTLLSRFEFACFYCFEGSIRSLWSSIVREGRHPYEGTFRDVSKKFNNLVAIWVHLLEDRYGQLVREPIFQDGVNVAGFRLSMDHPNVYAARFFWDGCSDEDKDCLRGSIYERFRVGDLDFSILEGDYEFVHYFYSLLTPSQKYELFSENYKEDEDFMLWNCLLKSPSSESVLNDILAAPFPARPHTYSCLLSGAARVAKELHERRDTFDTLWNPLTEEQRMEFFTYSDEFLHELTEEGDVDFLQTFIRPFSAAVKESMLLDDLCETGITAVDLLSRYGHYDELRRYLLLFLVSGVRDDLLGRFLVCEKFVNWMEKGAVPSYRKRKVVKVVEGVRGSSQVLFDLLERVADEIDGRTVNFQYLRPGERKLKRWML